MNASHIAEFLTSMDEPEMSAAVLTMHTRLEAFANGLDRDCISAAVEAAVAEKRARLEIAMTTLRQISDTPRNKGARRNANATVRFLDSMPPNAGA